MGRNHWSYPRAGRCADQWASRRHRQPLLGHAGWGRVVWAAELPRGTAVTVVIVNRSSKARSTVGVDALLLQG